MHARSWSIICSLLSLARPSTSQFLLNAGRISIDEVRLLGGSTPNEGRLQIKRPPDGPWQTVCTNVNAIDDTIAFALCARLGYKVACDYGAGADFDLAGPAVDLSPFEEMSFEACEVGPNPWEFDCVTIGFSSEDDACSQDSQDLWLRCASEPGDLELRLADPLSSFTGVIQARCRGSQEWMSVCPGSSWDGRDAEVACRHLGFAFLVGRRTISPSSLDPTAATPARIAISEFGCIGNETDFLQCQLGLVRTSCPTVPRISCGIETSEYGSQVGLCGNNNLCGTECAQRLDVTDFPRIGCHCDDVCMMLDDCCYDYLENCNPEGRDPPTSIGGLPIDWVGCVDVPGFDTVYQGYYLVNSCPGTWSGSGVRDSCESPRNQSDVFGSIPVYNNVSLVHYKNIYCAICRGELYTEMTPWTVEARYSPAIGGMPFLPNFDVGPPPFGTFTGKFVVIPPEGSREDIRQCSAPVIDTCLEEFRGSETERGCMAYAAAMTYRPASFAGFFTNYRNPYCGKCNNNTLSLVDSCGYNYCEEPCDSDPWSRCYERCASGEDFLTLDVLFSFKTKSTSTGPGAAVSCLPGEIYDPFLGSCRVLSCSIGYEVQNNDCVKVIAPPTISPGNGKGASPSFAYNPNSTVNLDVVNCLTVVFGDTTQKIVYWRAFLINSSDTLTVNFLAENETGLDDINDALRRLTGVSWCNVTSAGFFLELSSILPVDSCLDYYFSGSSLFQGYFGEDDSTRVIRVSQYDYDSSMMLYQYSEIDAACVDYNLTCSSIVTLNSTEFVRSESGNETLLEYKLSGRVLPKGTYVVLEDGGAVVCTDAVIVTPTDQPTTVTELAYRNLNLVLNILSLIALAVTFVVYCLLPTLRNLAGRCIMNLVVALFVANFLLLVNGFLIEVPTLCLVAAPIIHLTWLAAFMWMGALSFNVARTITSKVANRSNLPTTKPLLLYMLFAWGTSLAIVCICLALHFCQCAGTGPIYASERSCYIVNSDVNLYAFGVPVALTLTISVCLFVYTVVNLRISRSSTRAARNETRLQEAKVEFVIYVRLCVLMGLSWIFGFLTQVVEGYAMLFIFVILNSLQGVLIFLSFCFTGRVRGLLTEKYRQSCRSRRREQTKRKKAGLIDSSENEGHTPHSKSTHIDTSKV